MCPHATVEFVTICFNCEHVHTRTLEVEQDMEYATEFAGSCDDCDTQLTTFNSSQTFQITAVDVFR